MVEQSSVERHHWVNTFVGVLDAAYHLSEEEQYYVSRMVVQLLDFIDVPARGQPVSLPAALALEVESSFYTVGLYGPKDSGVVRPVRAVGASDIPVSVEAWCQMLVSMLNYAYPDLEPPEMMISTKVFSDILIGIGVPQRAASAYPDGLVRAYWETDQV